MTRRQLGLITHVIAVVALLLVVVPVVTELLGGPLGYLVSLALYWMVFCLPAALIHVLPASAQGLFSPRIAQRSGLLVIAALALQVVATAWVGLVPHMDSLTTATIALGVGVAVVNGSLEEIAWRGGFMTTFADRPVLGFVLCLVFFTVWHVPLALAHGITYDGGPAALVGGAAALGLVYCAAAWWLRSVFWPAVAHVATNAAVFPVLFAANDFV